MEALALLKKHRGRKSPVFPYSEEIPLDGVVNEAWQDLVKDDKQAGAVNRISYEWCVLTTLREKLRCKELWVKGARRFRNPDEDLPQDFETRRHEYYAALHQPLEAKVFAENVRSKMEAALAALNSDLPTNPNLKIVTTKKGKGRIRLSPLEAQPEPPNIAALTAALVQRWRTSCVPIFKDGKEDFCSRVTGIRAIRDVLYSRSSPDAPAPQASRSGSSHTFCGIQ